MPEQLLTATEVMQRCGYKSPAGWHPLQNREDFPKPRQIPGTTGPRGQRWREADVDAFIRGLFEGEGVA